jgi:hypothetical protein
MSRLIDLCEDSDDIGEQPITASLPSLPLSKKRPRDKEESSDDAHPRNENGPTDKNATDSAEFVVDLELVDEVEVSPAHTTKRRGVLKSERCVKNDAAGKCAQIGSDDAQVADHPESHEGIAAAASHPMNSDVKHTSPDDESKNKFSQNASTSKAPGRRFNVSAWEDRLSELSEYRKIHGHCNVPQRCSKYPKLARWVTYQRRQYKGNFKGKTSHMTLPYIQELESLGFEWGVCNTAWEDHLNDLADYRKTHGHCNVPWNYSENTRLAYWVGTERREYKLHQEGKKSNLTTFRIQELESLGFEWNGHGVTWEARLSELADYRKIHGHCNVPQRCSEYPKLANWVFTQRCQYKVNPEGKKSHIKLSRLKELENLGFDWGVCATSWEDRLSELAEYRIIHGHCNVPNNCSEHTRLAYWVGTQRREYRLHQGGKKSSMTSFRIQELESIGFEWDSRGATWAARLSELANYREIHGHCNVPTGYSENTKLAKWVRKQWCQYRLRLEGKPSSLKLSRIQALENIGLIGTAPAPPRGKID